MTGDMRPGVVKGVGGVYSLVVAGPSGGGGHLARPNRRAIMEFGFEALSKTTGVVIINGRLDLLSASELKNRLQELVAGGWSRLVLDIDAVPFIDSSGLGAIIAGLKAARVAGGDCRIARPGEQIQHILQVSTLDRVLTPYNTVEEALAGYK